MGGLLFLAFAYFAVGQAAANRNDAQTAADAAALAAAQNTRDQLAGAWVKDFQDPKRWQDIFDGVASGLAPSCWRADQLAAQNDAVVLSCQHAEPLRYTVKVETLDTVGDSIVPGTENTRSTESATAVIEPRCLFDPLTDGAEEDKLPVLTCKGEKWELDPEGPMDLLPKPEDLFDVHLAD